VLLLLLAAVVLQSHKEEEEVHKEEEVLRVVPEVGVLRVVPEVVVDHVEVLQPPLQNLLHKQVLLLQNQLKLLLHLHL